jgi:hypothetical protein
MKPYDQTLGLEKMCLVFLYNPNDLFILCNYECDKNSYFKKYTMLYVVLFGYGRGATHWICSLVCL